MENNNWDTHTHTLHIVVKIQIFISVVFKLNHIKKLWAMSIQNNKRWYKVNYQLSSEFGGTGTSDNCTKNLCNGWKQTKPKTEILSNKFIYSDKLYFVLVTVRPTWVNKVVIRFLNYFLQQQKSSKS